jgi:hypothetical protein
MPLTRFHNNTGEFLGLALGQPVTLTKHDRVVLTICEAGYFERLEAFAAANGGPLATRQGFKRCKVKAICC